VTSDEASGDRAAATTPVVAARPSPRTPSAVVRLCCEPHHLRTTIAVALVVGTVLFAINQLDVVLAGRASAGTAVKILLTYLVPFCVANFGIVHATASSHRDSSRRD
jgi:hypothetical protein